MEIPLLSSAPAAFARRNVRPPSKIGVNLVLPESKLSDATTKLLKTDSSTEELKSPARRGYLDSLAEYLQELGSTADKIRRSLNNENLTLAQREALQNELSTLEAGFQSLKGDSRINDALGAIEASANGEVFVEGLGQRFNDLLSAHQFASTSRISNALNGISKLSLLDLGSGEQLAQFGKDIAEALSGAKAPSAPVTNSSASELSSSPITLVGQQQSFALGEGIALTLRTLDSRGMIQAAASGLDQDLVSHLIIEVPQSHKKGKNDPYEDNDEQRNGKIPAEKYKLGAENSKDTLNSNLKVDENVEAPTSPDRLG